jgi:hypothetical protein
MSDESEEGNNQMQEAAEAAETGSEVVDVAPAEDVETAAVTESRRRGMSRGTVIVLLVAGCILLAVANVAVWAARDLFDARRFGSLVAEGLQTDKSTQVLAGEIVDLLLTEFPDIPRIARLPAEELVATLLQRPAFTVVFEGAAGAAIVVMTTDVRDKVSIDLERVLPFLIAIITAIDPKLAADISATAQDSRVLQLMNHDELPRLNQAATVTPWLALVTLLGALVIFGVVLWRAADRSRALKYSGWGVIISAAIGLLIALPAGRIVENNIANPQVRVVVGEVWTALTRPLVAQSLLLIILGAIVLIVNYFYSAGAESAPETEAA